MRAWPRPRAPTCWWAISRAKGRGAEDDYAIYGNFFYQNRNEALFQGEGNVALYGNLFVNDYGDAVRIQPHNDIPRRRHGRVQHGAGQGRGDRRGAEARRAPVPAGRDRERRVRRGSARRRPGARATSWRPWTKQPRISRRPFAPPGELDLRPSWDWAATIPGEALPARHGRTGTGISMGDRAPRAPSAPTARSTQHRDGCRGSNASPTPGRAASWFIMAERAVRANLREHHAEQADAQAS